MVANKGQKQMLDNHAADPTQDKGLWAAMFLICEVLYTAPEMPFGKDPPTGTQKRDVVLAAIGMASQGEILDACFMALGERTAVPGENVIFQPTTGEQMHDDQVELCHSLTDDAGPGAGQNYKSDPVLNNCDTAGLSNMYVKYMPKIIARMSATWRHGCKILPVMMQKRKI